MKRTLVYTLLLAGLALASCNKQFQRINTNPNNLEKPDAATLLSNVIVSEFYNNTFIAWTLGNGYSQYMTFSQDYYNTGTRYLPVTNEPYWTPLYESARDANVLYEEGTQKNNPFLQAAALTLRSYAFAQLTELWGDIPFKNALQGAQGKFTPSYDSQQTVYTDSDMGILPSLRRADSLLSGLSTGTLPGDVLYSGHINSWRKFINALRLRYLLRVSSQMNVAAEMQSILSEGMLMQDATESASLTLPNTLPYNFPSLTERSGDFNVKFLNSTLYNAFQQTSDSVRLMAYFAPSATASTTGSFQFSNYGGMPLVVNASSDQANGSSHFNSNFRTIQNAGVLKSHIITYAEQEFILAEAALKGYIAGSPSMYYENGIEGAFEEIGLSKSAADTYGNQSTVLLDAANVDTALSQIITQKWIANIGNGFEGWIEYNRTGYPAFSTGGSANMNNGSIPTRFLYPATEKSINSTNYNTEITHMGGTETTTFKGWWDK